MCSYGGKIQPRQHDNQLTYVAGDTKIFAVDRNIKFSLFLSKLSTLSQFQPNSLCFRYQLPGEDLDALISVTNDEDLEHMMLEYDRLYRASTKPVRLRLFLFPTPPPTSSAFSSSDSKSDRQWFVDALNSVQNQSQNDSASSTAVTPPLSATPDFLFGFDKDGHGEVHAPPCKVAESVLSPKVEDRSFVNESEIERQINDVERMNLNTGNYGDFYGQKPPENVQQPPASYYQERPGNEQMYYIPANTTGVYQTQVMRPVTGQVGQGYYGMQRMVVPDVYREQQVYSVVPQQQQQQSFQQKNVGPYNMGPTSEHGFGQVGYDAQGRQVYYTTAVQQQQFQAVEGRQGGGELNQDSR